MQRNSWMYLFRILSARSYITLAFVLMSSLIGEYFLISTINSLIDPLSKLELLAVVAAFLSPATQIFLFLFGFRIANSEGARIATSKGFQVKIKEGQSKLKSLNEDFNLFVESVVFPIYMLAFRAGTISAGAFFVFSTFALDLIVICVFSSLIILTISIFKKFLNSKASTAKRSSNLKMEMTRRENKKIIGSLSSKVNTFRFLSQKIILARRWRVAAGVLPKPLIDMVIILLIFLLVLTNSSFGYQEMVNYFTVGFVGFRLIGPISNSIASVMTILYTTNMLNDEWLHHD